MNRRRMTRTEQQAETRSRLLEAAAEEFAARGFDGSTIDAITERAGYTRGAFYSNFASKADLLTALGEQRMNSFARDVLPGMVGDDTADARAAAMWLIEQTPPTELLLLIELARLRDSDPQVRETIEGFVDGVLEFVDEMVHQAGTPRPELPEAERAQLTRALLAIVTGVQVLRHLEVEIDASTVAGMLAATLSAHDPSAAPAADQGGGPA